MKGWAWFYKIYLRHPSLLLFKTITGVDEELLLEGLDRVGIGDENLLKNLIIKDKVGLNSTSALLLYSILPYRLPSKLYGRSKGNWYRKLSRGKSFYFWMKSLEVRYQWSCQKNIFFVYNMVIGYCCGGTMDGVSIGEISSEIDRSSLCDIEKSSFKCFEIGLKMILPTQVHTQRITKTLLVHLPDL